MSISGALSNALSGLTAASRSAEVVASNIANAATEGYATRSVSLSSRQGTTGGVRIDDIQRFVDKALLAERRLADADHEHSKALSQTFKRVAALFGSPLEDSSLVMRAAVLETSLVEAASRPESPERLAGVVFNATALVQKMNEISDGLQSIRTEADRSIADQVARLNRDLEQVQQINQRIVSFEAQGVETAPLLDERQTLINRIGQIVPVIEVPRDRGAIALFTPGGSVLLDGPAARIAFEPANQVAPHMTQSAGFLSGLTLNSVPISTDRRLGPMQGGSLGAAFQIRDEVATEAQTQLDATARDLLERFASPSLDPTLVVGQAGLFTDAGTPFDPAQEVGLSGRISLNASVDPSQGGALWRLKEGIAASASGNAGDGALLNRMLDTLATARAPSSEMFNAGSLSFSELTARVLSNVGSLRQQAEQHQSSASIRVSALQIAELENGVDTDDQLQRLMLIEQAYSANARVIQTVNDMIDSLLRI
ncbi:flagellar hook-associated protein FlgK [Seohaeicola saemankumensis]|uniref:flagellar hook-associated protein FlgK n=1 Tax=Seohaeicola saemankumensis TaxID=481181 RepID=UPI001E4E2462|nr:flagellar hook-associated protein FlgK [Seohaeicola saemankumensis]MCD1625021.1 flagellar hook-associated protein FlgK [Seohaeicola saemankumensis]